MFSSVRVNRKAADRIRSGHPWIFSTDIVDAAEAQPGDVVRLLDHRGRVLGTAHYSSKSKIALRLLSSVAEPVDKSFFLRRLTEAAAFRERVVRDSNACRLVFSEADLLPGLIVDRYGPYLVLQTLTQGMERSRDLVAHCLKELLQPAGVLARNDASVRSLEGLPKETAVLAGQIPEQIAVEMNGLKLRADPFHGQKTGAYLDQRENYIAAANWARGRVLDCFTSTGGFALHAARLAAAVEAIDSSASALEIAEANARANGIANIQFRRADAFDFLKGIERRYSMVVLDPPAFAKSRSQIEDAMRGYKEINWRALRLLDPGGILVSCSCSHHISEAALLEITAQAALEAGKNLRVLERRTQASDHPILLTVPETMYLKCLFFQVIPT
ncbi:MAG TPA: class I SAM-dependent rRNA methyltransferase [Bryobacteraceae bacterium]